MTRTASRSFYLQRGLDLMGVPYIWGGRNHDGVDCSGVPIMALYDASLGSIDLRKWWSDKLWMDLEETKEPAPGDLAFYGGNTPKDVQHVMVVLVAPGGQVLYEGIVFGAVGGNHTTLTEEIAEKQRASVRSRDSTYYRPDFRGFRSMRRFLADT